MGNFSLAVCLAMKNHLKAFLTQIVMDFVHIMFNDTNTSTTHLLTVGQGHLLRLEARSFIKNFYPAAFAIFMQFDPNLPLGIACIAMTYGIDQSLFDAKP
jgi:hypothetical protein